MKALNNFKATLAAAVTTTSETAWTLSAADAALLAAENPSTEQPIRIQVREANVSEPAAADCEWVDVTAANGSTGAITVVRGVEGTAQTWAVGDELRGTPTAGWANQVAAEALADGITGLEITRLSATQLKVDKGAAYVPGLERWVTLATALTPSPSLSASAWHYLYLYDNSGSAAVEVSTTAPDTPYYGQARYKTGDSSKRFIGVVLSDGSSQLEAEIAYGIEGGALQRIEFLDPQANQNFLTGGTATSFTSASFSSYVPASVTLQRGAFVVVAGSSSSNENQSRIRLPSTTGLYQRNVGNAVTGQSMIGNTEIGLAGNTALEYMNSHADGSTGLQVSMITLWR